MQQILDKRQIEQKINRLAHQILENTFEEGKIYLGGIQGNGFMLASKLSDIIKNNSDLEVETFEIKMNKDEPWSQEIVLSLPKETLKNEYIILVDDVVNSGKTMQYALIELLRFPTRAIKTVTLVDRTHRRFPIKADFVGLSLSTTLKEHVEVDLSEGSTKAYLT